MTTVNTHVYFPAELYAKIVDLAREKRVAVAKLIRDLVTEGIEKKQKKRKDDTRSSSLRFWDQLFAMKVKEGPKDLSTNYKKYLFDE